MLVPVGGATTRLTESIPHHFVRDEKLRKVGGAAIDVHANVAQEFTPNAATLLGIMVP